jgi:hypothetical protein
MKTVTDYSGFARMDNHSLNRYRYPHLVSHVTKPRTCWLDNVEAVARYEIGRLDCGQWVNIEGVLVTRTSAHARLRYTVNGCPACGLREAVQAVCEAVAEGGEQP